MLKMDVSTPEMLEASEQTCLPSLYVAQNSYYLPNWIASVID